MSHNIASGIGIGGYYAFVSCVKHTQGEQWRWFLRCGGKDNGEMVMEKIENW